MKSTLIGVIALVMAGPVQAQDWRATGQGDNVIAGVRQSSIQREEQVVNYWAIDAYRSRPGEALKYMLHRVRLDCTTQAYSYLQTTPYMADGSVGERMGQSEERYIVPGSMLEVTFEAVCSDRWPPGAPSFDSPRSFHDGIQSYF